MTSKKYEIRQDSFTCLNDVELKLTRMRESKSFNGFVEKQNVYSAPESECAVCFLRSWHNINRRYLLSSLPKVTLEAGLHGIAHNTKKIYFFIMEKVDPLGKPYIII